MDLIRLKNKIGVWLIGKLELGDFINNLFFIISFSLPKIIEIS